ncbi:MAG: beta galactosidase jelly roll domain-containing protein, partial [Draconibacterium sp.]|nr:beta galactosidase jelly roll domain-containing protein [Draconibacterium sp.]
MKTVIILSVFIFFFTNGFCQTRQIITLETDWKFINQEVEGAEEIDLSTGDWETVEVPHDWAIKGPFDKGIDAQRVRVQQDMDKEARLRTGRTGALPHIGVGWYRKTFEVPTFKKGKKALLVFDGAMSDAHVWVNGKKVGNHPYGYAYFYFDITEYLKEGENLLAVRLENKESSSRWYPGAGIYRKVQIIVKDKVSFNQWGTFITTPFVSEDIAQINIKSAVNGNDLKMVTEIKDAKGKVVASKTQNELFGNKFEQNIAVPNPKIWDIETPNLYTAHLKLFQNDELKDEQSIRFGIRSVVYERGKGLILNGKVTKFKGVCLHHDLGPLGAAINKAALKRQLTIMKEMGCNS